MLQPCLRCCGQLLPADDFGDAYCLHCGHAVYAPVPQRRPMRKAANPVLSYSDADILSRMHRQGWFRPPPLLEPIKTGERQRGSSEQLQLLLGD